MKKKAGVLVSAIATTAVCASLIVGSTFALFTSEDAVNIAVTSGNVDVTAEIKENSLKLSSMGRALTGNVWENGGTATIESGKLDIQNITPGDEAKFSIALTNNSSVSVKYRVKYSVTGDLAEMLDYSLNVGTMGEWSNWALGEAKEKEVAVSVALPEEAGSAAQGKSASISFVVEAIQGNADMNKYATDTASAQKLLDEANEGDTIVLKAGNYDTLYLRQSTKSVQDEVGYTQWNHTWVKRSFKNLTIRGEEGAVVQGVELGSTLYNSGEASQINPIDGSVTTGALYASYFIDDLSFVDLTVKEQFHFTLEGYTPDNYIKGITFTNCNSVDNDLGMATGTNKFIDVRGSKSCPASDVVADNCTVNNRYQGVYFQYVNGVTVKNCQFDTTTHNAIAVQSGCSGDVLLSGNTIKNTGDRAVRFDVFDAGSISILGNTLVNAADSDGQIVKATSVAEGVAVSFIGNDWGSAKPFNEIVIGFASVTETDGITINSAEELTAFAAQVNGGNNFAGKTVVLTADIDLENKEWTPIGTYGTNTVNSKAFNGIFDGRGYTVSNLKISSGNMVGLFGYIQDSATVIKNVKLDNVNISGSERVGSAVGNLYLGTVENITVTNANLKGEHWVGGVVGQTYGTIKNCYVDGLKIVVTPMANENGVNGLSDGDKAGGIVGQAFSSYITDCTVKNAEITAWRDLGGIAGSNTQDGKIPSVSGCHVENVTLSFAKAIVDGVEVDVIGDNDKNVRMGAILGRGHTGETDGVGVTDCTQLNVTLNK